MARVDYVFDNLGWDSVSHLIASENTRSQALAERLGAKPVGESQMPGSLSRHQVTEWRQSAAHWRSHRDAFDAVVPR